MKDARRGWEIEVFAKSEDNNLVNGVAEQGIGISRRDQSKLFEPCHQLDGTIAHRDKGVGLGLLVCRRLVEAHNGKIWVESEPGSGSTFFFTIPLR